VLGFLADGESWSSSALRLPWCQPADRAAGHSIACVGGKVQRMVAGGASLD